MLPIWSLVLLPFLNPAWTSGNSWFIPVTGEPGGLPSMGSHRVRHDWSDLAAAVLLKPGLKCSTWMQSQKWQNDLCLFPRKSIQYHSNPSLCPCQNAKEAEAERFYEYLQDLPELTPKKDVLFVIGDWNEKVGSQEIPGVTGKFDLGVRNEARQKLIEFCQENTLVIANTLF